MVWRVSKMFRRRNSQKPTADLYVAFKKAFPNLRSGSKVSIAQTTSGDTCAILTATSPDTSMDNSRNMGAGGGSGAGGGGHHESQRDQDNVLMDPDHWRFTPSTMESSTFNFNAFINHPSGDLTPTPGAYHSVFHNQAGDLHTPAAPFQLGTPLSGDDTHANPAIDVSAFHTHLLHSQGYQDHGQHFSQQQAYAPSSFVQRDQEYETMDPSHAEYLSRKLDERNQQAEAAGLSTTQYAPHSMSQAPSLDKFRFHVTLNAPTAMVKSTEEIPITYLNKGQAYAISINDSLGLAPSTVAVKYRTVIRISFEDEEQRQRPSQSWQLWKEGRGLAEAHQRGGKLQAVEYVDPSQGGEIESRRPRVDLEAESFDCFSVTWSPTAGSSVASCSVSVRFNFLSTDFSHSKGVKGIPVRLCAKTEVISSGTPDSPPGPTAEVCYCKVKLFRDHGAERKLSNDIAHIKKTIDKLKQQISQVESGLKDVGKRKRSGSMVASHRAGKVPKHKRTWSLSSQGSSGRPGIEEDLASKLATTQDMFSSTRPVSVLYLRGYNDDDPDLCPVHLPGDSVDLTRISTSSRRASWEQKPSSTSTPTNPVISPTPTSSTHSAPSQSRTTARSFLREPPAAHWEGQKPDDGWRHPSYPAPAGSTPTVLSHGSIKVPTMTHDSAASHWINASGIDPSYQAPPERSVKPVACFYVLIKIFGDALDDDCYRAVYLMERTVKELIFSIANKCGMQPDTVYRTIRINPKGLKIMVDDEVVRELPEGQDMIVEFSDLDAVKSEAGSGNTTPKAAVSTSSKSHSRLEMRLIF